MAPSFRTRVAGVSLDRAALERVTTGPAVAEVLASVAAAIGEEAARIVGTFQGFEAEPVVLNDTLTPGDSNALSRRRAAVLLKHPTPLGRQAAALSLLMAIDR